MFPFPFHLFTDLPAILIAGLVIHLLWPKRATRMQISYSSSLGINLLIGASALVAGTLLVIVAAVTIVGIPLSVVLACALIASFYVGGALAAVELGRVMGILKAKDDPLVALLVGSFVMFVVSLVPTLGDLTRMGLSLVGLGAVINSGFGTGADRFGSQLTKSPQLATC